MCLWNATSCLVDQLHKDQHSHCVVESQLELQGADWDTPLNFLQDKVYKKPKQIRLAKPKTEIIYKTMLIGSCKIFNT